MKQEMLGITKDKNHSQELSDVERRFLVILQAHVGRENAISADDLASMFYTGMSMANIFPSKDMQTDEDRKVIDEWKRQIRSMHNHLLKDHGMPILSQAGSGGGYWISVNEDEVSRFYYSFRQRGLTGLVKASRGKRAAIVDAVNQLAFEFGDLVDRSGLKPEKSGKDQMAPEIVDALLEKMTLEPERFADDLRRIGRKFGSVLLPKDQLATMKQKMAELTAMFSGIAG